MGASSQLPVGPRDDGLRVPDHDEWLLCGGPKCQFKGHGTVNGVGGYSFLLTAIDRQLPGGAGRTSSG